jgi:hypothetical protein
VRFAASPVRPSSRKQQRFAWGRGQRWTKGLQGEQGPESLHVGPEAPVDPPPRFVWVQTGLGPSGTDMTFWVEDGT